MGTLSELLGPSATSIRGGKKKSWASLSAFFDSVSGYGTNKKATIKEQIDAYTGWVNIACSVLYKRVAEIPWRYFRSDTGEEIKPSPRGLYPTINRIFMEPNQYQDMRSIISYLQLSLDLTGMAFLLREDDPVFGTPLRLWPLNTSRFYKFELADTLQGWIKSFCFRFDDGFKFYKPENILYFNYQNPSDPRLPFSVIQGQANVVNIDEYLEKYESKFFQNSARPDIILSYPENVQLDEDEAKKILEDWRKKFQGVDKAHQITITDQGAKVEKLTVQNADLALSWLAGWTADKIMAAYNVPKATVGLVKDVNKNSAQATTESFNSEAVLPRLRLLEGALNRGVLRRFDPRLEMRFDNPVPRDRQQLTDEHKIKTGISTRTLNEQRALDGQKPVKNGDEIFIPLNYIALSDRSPSRDVND